MLFLTKMISRFLFPVPLCLTLLLIGLVFLWFTRRQLLGKLLCTASFVVFALFASSLFSDKLLANLESRYPAFLGNDNSKLSIKYIAVLGGGANLDPKLPPTSWLGQATLIRLIEGIRLHENIPGTKLILSGGSYLNVFSEAQLMSTAAQQMGVKAQDIIVEDKSRNTEEEAQLIKPVVDTEPFLLVTSASHMPRSILLFRKRGLNPIPAPTDYQATPPPVKTALHWIPSASSLFATEKAFYEYLGIAWGKLKGAI